MTTGEQSYSSISPFFFSKHSLTREEAKKMVASPIDKAVNFWMYDAETHRKITEEGVEIIKELLDVFNKVSATLGEEMYNKVWSYPAVTNAELFINKINKNETENV